jgi:hypothetical protein
MAKYMVLYKSAMTASDQMANVTPEQMQDSMAKWLAWRDEATQTFSVEFGLPLKAIGNVSANGVGESATTTTGYSIIEGEPKETLIELLKLHPHLQQPGTSIDVLEMLPIPGVDS